MNKVITLLGTRPEIIRLSLLIPKLDKYFDHSLVHTGQNYDYELNNIFFDDLSVRKPDHFLGINNSSFATAIGDLFVKTEKLFLSIKPDAVLVLGDTNSGLALYIARRLRIPTYHLEAGNRSFDSNVPEEVNRRILDHLSDFNLVYSEAARHNLLREGLSPRTIYNIGSPLREVLDFYEPNIRNSSILQRFNLHKNSYIVLSLHREENVDNSARLSKLINSLSLLAERLSMRVIMSVHPRTKKLLQLIPESSSDLLEYCKPFSFTDYMSLQINSYCTLSDSGTISEESSICNFPAVTLRYSMERPECLETSGITMSTFEPGQIYSAIQLARTSKDEGHDFMPKDYTIDNSSQRVANILMSTINLASHWYNRNPPYSTFNS